MNRKIPKQPRTLSIIAVVVVSMTSQAHAIQPFDDVTDAVGLKGVSGGVAAWGDYNNDGWVDLYCGGQLWRNEKGKRFVRVEKTPLRGAGIWGDYNNDGFLDLFSWKRSLFRNVNGNTFVDQSKKFPILPMNSCLGACWGDFDGDGYLDVYVGGYESPAYQPDAICRNMGDGSFVKIWQTKGTNNPARGITAADFDEDGDLDIYVSNYRLVPNHLLLNNGKGKFKDVGGPYGVAGDGGLGAWGHTIGSCWGDFDNDGHLDLFAGNFSHRPAYQDRPKFYKNLGPKKQFHFQDMTEKAGLHWQESYASPTLGDFDNDGLLDLFFTTVYPGDHSVLYRNTGDWKFTNVTAQAKINTARTYQAAWADFDNDGDLDLISGGRLFRNPGGKNRWLKIRVRAPTNPKTGMQVNHFAVGAQARVFIGKQILTRQVEGATGQGNQNDLTMHFGLGAAPIAKKVKVEIRWPNGSRQNIETQVDRTVTVEPAVVQSGFNAHKGLDYAGTNNKRHQLDIYIPKSATNPPLVVWIHGGAWRNGSKDRCGILWLADRGFAVASINYRLSGESVFPAQIHDCKAAIRWLRANAKKYGYDAGKIGVAGSSAGGHLVALLGTSGGVKELEGKVGKHLDQSSNVEAVCDLFGPTDFLQMDKHAIPGSRLIHDSPRSPESLLIGGPIQKHKEKVAKANPITYVDRNDPPFLILHGDKDMLVPIHQSIIFEKALRIAGANAHLQILEGAGHGGKQFSSPMVRQMILAFYRKHLK